MQQWGPIKLKYVFLFQWELTELPHPSSPSIEFSDERESKAAFNLFEISLFDRNYQIIMYRPFDGDDPEFLNVDLDRPADSECGTWSKGGLPSLVPFAFWRCCGKTSLALESKNFANALDLANTVAIEMIWIQENIWAIFDFFFAFPRPHHLVQGSKAAPGP